MRSRCVPYDRSFDSEASLKQHKRTSLVHAFNCTPCNRRFDSEEALQQHLRDPRIQDTETPLDIFFRSFPAFNYDPSLSPATSYTNLQRQEGWRRNIAASDDTWNRYQDAL
ncbi:hypothetical protein G7Y89_g5351 [Cudoniella acicularis]|uniref:C2H2-type domain-containing protein n=1 Tax=Cudoniella acicularis TaxID=354080 RepID=A0A8H4RNH0_9HELO|nr:hypothetical protein G7Y89_g5351 [Cudoniella acicularis]